MAVRDDGLEDVETRLALAGFLEAAGQCLSQLTGKNLNRILSKYVDEVILEHIAVSFNISVATAWRRCREARLRMKNCLETKGYFYTAEPDAIPPGAGVVVRLEHGVLVYAAGNKHCCSEDDSQCR